MSTDTQPTDGTSPQDYAASRLIRADADEIVGYFNTHGFETPDADSEALGYFRKHKEAGIIERLDEAEQPEDETHYRVLPGAYRRALAVRRNRDAICPCGDAGIRNLGNDQFECCFNGCDRVFSQEELN